MKAFIIHTLSLIAIVVLIFLIACSNKETTKPPSSLYSTGMQEPYSPPTPKSLFYLTSSSSLVVVGKVIKTDLVTKNLSKEEMAQLDDLSKTIGGRLHTIQVEIAFCSKQDFVAKNEVSSYPKEILIFKKRESPEYIKEWYNDGEKYLLFLSEIPEQKLLTKQYALSNGQIYYESFEGERTKITNKSLALLKQLKVFCDALRSSNPEEKIASLNNLIKTTSDPEVKKSAQEAIIFIKKVQEEKP